MIRIFFKDSDLEFVDHKNSEKNKTTLTRPALKISTVLLWYFILQGASICSIITVNQDTQRALLMKSSAFKDFHIVMFRCLWGSVNASIHTGRSKRRSGTLAHQLSFYYSHPFCLVLLWVSDHADKSSLNTHFVLSSITSKNLSLFVPINQSTVEFISACYHK